MYIVKPRLLDEEHTHTIRKRLPTPFDRENKTIPKKNVIDMSHKKNPWLSSYIMQDVPLQSSPTQKYLGVELTSNIDWNIHISTITTKAKKTLDCFVATSAAAHLQPKRLPTKPL